MKKLLAALALFAALGTTACNTAAGIGQDVEATGDAITDTAKDTKKKL